MALRSFRICYDEGVSDGQETGTLSSFTLTVPSLDVPSSDLVTCVRDRLAIPPSQPLSFTLEPSPGAAPGADALPLSAALPDGTCLRLQCSPPRRPPGSSSVSPSAAAGSSSQQPEAYGATVREAQLVRRVTASMGASPTIPEDGTGRDVQLVRAVRTALLDDEYGVSEVRPDQRAAAEGKTGSGPLLETFLPPSFKEISTDLANERTMLAWVRTGLAVIRTGFCFATLNNLSRGWQFMSVMVTIMLALASLGTLLVGWQRYLVVRPLVLLTQDRRIAVWPVLTVFVFVSIVCCLATIVRQPAKLMED